MDSPGFSAKYCLYVMMHTFLNVILDVEVVDKREASGTSTLMEKIGCNRILEWANSVLNIKLYNNCCKTNLYAVVSPLPRNRDSIIYSIDIEV